MLVLCHKHLVMDHMVMPSSCGDMSAYVSGTHHAQWVCISSDGGVEWGTRCLQSQ